jgi:hypothetical protein
MPGLIPSLIYVPLSVIIFILSIPKPSPPQKEKNTKTSHPNLSIPITYNGHESGNNSTILSNPWSGCPHRKSRDSSFKNILSSGTFGSRLISAGGKVVPSMRGRGVTGVFCWFEVGGGLDGVGGLSESVMY